MMATGEHLLTYWRHHEILVENDQHNFSVFDHLGTLEGNFALPCPRCQQLHIDMASISHCGTNT